MPELRMILTAVAIMAPALAAAIAIKQKEARTISAAAAAFSLAVLSCAIWFTRPTAGLLTIDELATAPALTFAAVMLALFVASPKRDASGIDFAGMLLCLSGTLTVYCAHDVMLMFAGFACAALPFLMRPWGERQVGAFVRPAQVCPWILRIDLRRCGAADDGFRRSRGVGSRVCDGHDRRDYAKRYLSVPLMVGKTRPTRGNHSLSPPWSAAKPSPSLSPASPFRCSRRRLNLALPLISDIALVGSLFTAFPRVKVNESLAGFLAS